MHPSDIQVGHPDRDAIPVSIHQDLEAVAVRAKQLHEVVADLQQRVGPVLGPERPDIAEVAGKLAEAPVERSAVGVQLGEVTDTLDSLIYRLRGVVERVEL